MIRGACYVAKWIERWLLGSRKVGERETERTYVQSSFQLHDLT